MDIADIATLITTLGVLIYVLGLLALGYPVYRTITNNSSTALYVVSVVPKTVVAGHGVRFLLGIPLVWTLFFTASLSVPWLIDSRADISSEDVGSLVGRVIPTVIHELPVIVTVAILVAVLGIHELMGAAGLYNIFYPYSSFRTVDRAGPPASTTIDQIIDPVTRSDRNVWKVLLDFLAPSVLIANIIGCIGGVVGGIILVAGEMSGQAVFSALLVVIIMNFIANALAVLSIKPPMPRAKVHTDEGKEITGYLLAHADAHWYIFDEKYTLLHTIRDEKASVDVPYP